MAPDGAFNRPGRPVRTMDESTKLEATIREHVRKRHEADDSGFLFGSERVDLRRVDHLKVEAKKRGFSFIVDEPAERGGTDQGPNPLAYFLAGAASCLVNQYLSDAIYRGVKVDDIALTARGHFDRRMGGAFTEIIYDLKLSSPSPRDAVARLSKEAEEMCYAHSTLKKAGVKMVTNVFLNGEPLV